MFAMSYAQQPAAELHIRKAHAAIMCSTFVALMPLGTLLVYLPTGSKRISYIHAPFQIFNACLTIAGLVLGVLLCSPGEPSSYHAVIGYVIVGFIVLVQPSLGLWQHLLFRKTGLKTTYGVTHRWLGRCIIWLGIINGGLGFYLAGPAPNNTSPIWGVLVYSGVASLVTIFYTKFLIVQSQKASGQDLGEMKEWPSDDSERTIIGYRNGSISSISPHSFKV